MGDMLRAKGENTSAAAEYRKATAVAPGFLAAHLGLARAFYSDHRAEEAEQEVRLVLAANPEDAEANYLMGEILVNGPAPAEALAYLQKALHVSPEERPYVHADLSKAYEEQGNRSLAIAELKQAVAIDGDGSYYYRQGRLYLSTGDRAAAKAAMEQSEKLRHATDAASLFRK